MSVRLIASCVFLAGLALTACGEGADQSNPPAQNRDTSHVIDGPIDLAEPFVGTIVTLYAHDEVANRYSLRDAQYSMIVQGRELRTIGSEIAFDCYGENSIAFGMSGGTLTNVEAIDVQDGGDSTIMLTLRLGADGALRRPEDDSVVFQFSQDKLTRGFKTIDMKPGDVCAYETLSPGSETESVKYLIKVLDLKDSAYLTFRWLRLIAHGEGE